jgi:tetratricopeptide (TPR) repeat protein
MRTVRLAEIESIPVGESGLRWKPLRHTLGIEAFGVNAYTAAEVGEEVVEDHDELGSGAGHHEELYVVVSGHAVFTVDGEQVDAPAGTCVFLDDPAERRAAVAKAPGTVVLAVGAPRGEAYAVSPWEFSFRAGHTAKSGHWDEALATMEEGLERYPENPSLLYNLACFEALAGSADAALEHLRRAAERDPKLRAVAQTDPDLAGLRSGAGFPSAEAG